MQKHNLSALNLGFKNLISGPAPVGRVLNYIKLAGNSTLKHKNGNRDIRLTNNIGCAWTTEFMIGLGLLSIGPTVSHNVYLLNLTDLGFEIFNKIKNLPDFNEGIRNKEIDDLRQYIISLGNDLYETLEICFRSSFPFIILQEYLNEKNTYYFSNKKVFFDDYFEEVKKLYDNNPTPYNRNARTTTGENRVPSLLQFCYFFNYFYKYDTVISFNEKAINKKDIKETLYTYSEMEQASQEEMILMDNLINQYGVDGTISHTVISRCSQLQRMFKHNLCIETGKKCVICGIENSELLIGSHIKPSAESNTLEKANSNNGLLLCANHDKLFDRYLISFDFISGQIWISKTLSENDINLLGLDNSFSLDSRLMNNERSNFLLHHNITFQNKEKYR